MQRTLGSALQVIDRLAQTATAFSGHASWPLIAVCIGAAPVLVSFVFCLPGHQWISGFLLGWLCLGFAREDKWVRGICAIVLMFLAHSAVAIPLAANYPQRCSEIMPLAADYWEKQQVWITTGEDPEYELKNWVPAHLVLAMGGVVYSFSSFGVVVFSEGLVQVDMMNYYNAQLMTQSRQPVESLAFGWHLWSLMRGVGFLFLTFESVSLSLQLFSWRQISSWRSRAFRWSAGLSFLLADGLIKYFALEPVRLKLFDNFQPFV